MSSIYQDKDCAVKVVPMKLVKLQVKAKVYRYYTHADTDAEAIKEAVKDYSHLQRISFFKKLSEASTNEIDELLQAVKVEKSESPTSDPIDTTPIKTSSLSNRSKNALVRGGYNFLEEVPRDEKELKKIQGLGTKSIKDILSLLK